MPTCSFLSTTCQCPTARPPRAEEPAPTPPGKCGAAPSGTSLLSRRPTPSPRERPIVHPACRKKTIHTYRIYLLRSIYSKYPTCCCYTYLMNTPEEHCVPAGYMRAGGGSSCTTLVLRAGRGCAFGGCGRPFAAYRSKVCILSGTEKKQAKQTPTLHMR